MALSVRSGKGLGSGLQEMRCVPAGNLVTLWNERELPADIISTGLKLLKIVCGSCAGYIKKLVILWKAYFLPSDRASPQRLNGLRSWWIEPSTSVWSNAIGSFTPVLIGMRNQSSLAPALSRRACAWNSGRGLLEVLTKMSLNAPKRTCSVEAEKILRDLSCQMCGGKDLDSYLEEFRSQGQSQCTKVWSKGNIAYRCRTCQTKDSRCCTEYFPLVPVFLHLQSLSINILSAMGWSFNHVFHSWSLIWT